MKCVRNFTCKPKRPRIRDPIFLRKKKIGRFITSDLKFTRKDTITRYSICQEKSTIHGTDLSI